MDKINFIEVLKEKRDLVWPTVEKAINEPIDLNSKKYKKDYSDILKFHLDLSGEYSNRKGKYIRATLLMLTAQTLGVPVEKTLKIAAAMQLSEDWLLIHDDLEDKSLERRGKPTLHRQYSTELAINAGDYIHALMWKTIRDSEQEVGTESMLKIFDEFQKILRRTIFGQTAEIKLFQDRTDLNDEDWYFIADGKISYYTIAGPIRLGAILAGVTQSQLETLLDFGFFLGRAFQIRDDYLDLTSDFAGLKKQQGNDIYEGKRTIMLGHLLRTCIESDKKQIQLILDKTREEKSQKEVDFVIDKMKQYGSLDYAQNIANDLASQAEKYFDEKLTFLKEEPARSQLKAGIKFMVERDH